MLVLTARNLPEAYYMFQWNASHYLVGDDSRNGRVKRVNMPVTTIYQNPLERHLIDRERDANPFFHYFESLWMLSGRRDVAFVSQFSKNIANYSDDGEHFNGAYGFRWRQHFDGDQLVWAIEHLQNNPGSRRCVVSMWDPTEDRESVDAELKDVPCNTQVYFLRRGGKLDMTVTNRSNDAIWGCYGANAVHFSYLHELVAAATGIPIGTYYQVSNDLHVYEQHWCLLEGKPFEAPMLPYEQLRHYPLIRDPARWWKELSAIQVWIEDQEVRSLYVEEVADPLYAAFLNYKEGDFAAAYENLSHCDDRAWAQTCRMWLARREAKRNVG